MTEHTGEEMAGAPTLHELGAALSGVYGFNKRYGMTGIIGAVGRNIQLDDDAEKLVDQWGMEPDEAVAQALSLQAAEGADPAAWHREIAIGSYGAPLAACGLQVVEAGLGDLSWRLTDGARLAGVLHAGGAEQADERLGANLNLVFKRLLHDVEDVAIYADDSAQMTAMLRDDTPEEWIEGGDWMLSDGSAASAEQLLSHSDALAAGLTAAGGDETLAADIRMVSVFAAEDSLAPWAAAMYYGLMAEPGTAAEKEAWLISRVEHWQGWRTAEAWSPAVSIAQYAQPGSVFEAAYRAALQDRLTGLERECSEELAMDYEQYAAYRQRLHAADMQRATDDAAALSRDERLKYDPTAFVADVPVETELRDEYDSMQIYRRQEQEAYAVVRERLSLPAEPSAS